MVEYLDIRSEMENKRLVAKRYSTMKGADSHYPFLKGEQKNLEPYSPLSFYIV